MKRLAIFLLLVSCVASAGKTEKVNETIVAAKDGSVEEREYFKEGTSHIYRLVTNYIVHVSSKGEKILLTVRCEQRWGWNACYALSSGQSYPAVFEYRRNKGSDLVWIEGQPGGNLTKPERMKSTIVNFEELKAAN
jgi:hypothetical protein